MSTCIGPAGEYSVHEVGPDVRCERCGADMRDLIASADMTDTDTRLETLTNEVIELRNQQQDIAQFLSESWTKLEPYLQEITPMVEQIQSSPMFKMIVGKRRD